MNIPETYHDLVRARRDLWAALDRVPDEVSSRPLLGGSGRSTASKIACFTLLAWRTSGFTRTYGTNNRR
jgi:hypothetical protein